MKRPIHTQKPGFGADNGGWRQPLSDLWTQLLAELHALRARSKAELEGPIGVPAAYQGVRIFQPQSNTISVTVPNVGVATVRPVVVDGQTYDIPIYFPGSGVFVARSLEVNIYQRWTLAQASGSASLHLLARQFSTAAAVSAASDGNIRQNRFSVVNRGVLDSWPSADFEEPVPAMQFWWNLLDSKSQRYLADNLLPQQALMPMTVARNAATGEPTSTTALPIDGGRFYFDAPWLVERDGQMRFQFRPTTAVYQYDSVPGGSSVALDTVDQDVLVQVELYGERYETLQDALRSGAMSRPVRGEEE